jgi:hypothetical protein
MESSDHLRAPTPPPTAVPAPDAVSAVAVVSAVSAVRDVLDVCGYLYPHEVGAFRISEMWRRFGCNDVEMIFEIGYWKVLCERRYGHGNHTLRIASASRWCKAYWILDEMQVIPRGIFTDNHNAVFGKGRSTHPVEGLLCWTLLGHTSDCRPRKKSSYSYSSSSRNCSIEVHLCVQNISWPTIKLMTDSIEAVGVDTSLHSYPMIASHLKLIAFNGIRVGSVPSAAASSSSPSVFEGDSRNSPSMLMQWMRLGRSETVLGWFDSCVFSFDVSCPESVENEVDFLVQLKSIKISASVVQASTPYRAPLSPGFTEALRSTSISIVDIVDVECDTISEEEIWTHYVQHPRNSVFLKQDCEA